MVRFFGSEEEIEKDQVEEQSYIPNSFDVNEDTSASNTSFVDSEQSQVANVVNNNVVEAQTQIPEQVTEQFEEQPIVNSVNADTPAQMVEQLGAVPVNQSETPDALNNARNPIPVNPISNKEEIFDYDSVEFKPKELINILFKFLTKPASTMEEASKYRSLNNSVKVTVLISLCTIVIKVVMSIVTGMFTKTYNVATSSYITKLDFIGMFNQEWLSIISTSFIVSVVAILLVTTTYYLVSFIRNKSIPYGRYLIITTISFIPFLIGYTIIYPIFNILSGFLAVILLIISLLFSIVNLLNNMNNCIEFNNEDERILYNSIVISIVVLILFTITYMLFPETLNITNVIAGK